MHSQSHLPKKLNQIDETNPRIWIMVDFACLSPTGSGPFISLPVLVPIAVGATSDRHVDQALDQSFHLLDSALKREGERRDKGLVVE